VAPAVKLLFDSLDALLVELRDRKVDIVRVSPAVAIERDVQASRVPQVVSRVLVTAALGESSWAEWRYRVGQAAVELGRSEFQLPPWLRERQDRALAEVARRVDEAGFQIREGILTHDQGVMDTFRL
jgi:hypothetical protein